MEFHTVLLVLNNYWKYTFLQFGEKKNYLVSVIFRKILDLIIFYNSVSDMIMWYWSSDTLFRAFSIDHTMNAQCQTSLANANLVVVVGGQTHPRAKRFAMLSIILIKELHRFPRFCFHMGLCNNWDTTRAVIDRCLSSIRGETHEWRHCVAWLVRVIKVQSSQFASKDF